MCKFNNAQSKAEKAKKKRKTRDKKRLPFSQILKFGIAIEPPGLQYCAKYFTCFTIWAMNKNEEQYMQAVEFLKELFDRLTAADLLMVKSAQKVREPSIWDILDQKDDIEMNDIENNRMPYKKYLEF